MNVNQLTFPGCLFLLALSCSASVGEVRAADARPVESTAALTASSAETELATRIPEIFAKAAEHYRALDAAATPLMRDAKGDPCVPHGWKKWKTGRDELDMRSIYWWTSGHYPGSLWYLYEATGDAFFKDRATVWTELLAPVSKYTGNHDVGFMMYCSYGNARRILKTDRYDELLAETARSLCTRYNGKLGLIRSWGNVTNTNEFLVIPDNMMNLELLAFAAEKDETFAKIAESHADVSMKHHFRPDGGCYHVLNYDQRPNLLGKVQEIRRGQGASCVTAWSRGQSWGIYGYTMMYRTSGYIRYLDFAKKLADYAMNHPNMPADGVPCWDYGAPGEERDTSAASCMASALIELSQYVGAADRDRYRAFAVMQLLALASPAYFSEGDEIGHWLLKHGVGHKPGGSEIDTPLDYGDYYFLEALLRFRNLKQREKAASAVSGLGRMPAKAALPADELLIRSRTTEAKALTLAEKALVEPIPDTTDALYGEFVTTGNRTHYEKRYFARIKNLNALVISETKEGKGRFLARIRDYLTAICDMKSWTLPAHDKMEGGLGTLKGAWLTTDLFGTEIAAHLACVVQALGNRLDPAIVRRIKAEAERRVFGPVRRELPSALFAETAIGGVRVRNHWWLTGGSNWNAVCWDNVVCAACGLVDDKADRILFAAAADRAAEYYIERGFAADGYCSEGMGYWNYGFGHHLMTGRMLRMLTDGAFDFFHRPKTRLVAAYARAYTLAPGVSPAFADGNGAVDPKLLTLVDEFWPDLPKDLPTASEFPDGQVWLFRDPEGLSVAFKGGHNAELHNHNDLGSYYIIDGGKFVAGDPGGEVYTARTFSGRRYESKVLNSYGHPVPVVGGKLQGTGRKYAAKVVGEGKGKSKSEKVKSKSEEVRSESESEEVKSKSEEVKSESEEGRGADVVVLDLTAAYDVKALKKLTRTFIYDRTAKTFTVRDRAEFSEPTAFEDCYVAFDEKTNVAVKGQGQVRMGNSTARHASLVTQHSVIDNPGRKTPHRFAWTFDNPVTEAEIEFVFKSDK